MTDYSGTTNSSTYSGREFKVYIGADATVGAKNASSNGVTMYRLDVEGITLPTFSPNQEFEMRTGTGRIAEFGAMFSSSKRTTSEISLSGSATLQDLPMFMENVLSQEATTNDNLFEIATGYSPGNFKDGDATGATVWNKTMTIHFVAPTAADSYTFTGCVCTSYSLTADMTTAGGRYDYSATFQTQYIAEKAADSMTAAQELTTPLGAQNFFLSDQSSKDMNIKSYDSDGTDATSISPVINTFSLNIESPTVFLGAQGANAEPEVFGRAVPELNVTFSGSLKYDTETDKLLEAHRDSGNDSYIQFLLSNKGPTSNFETPASIAIAADDEQLFGFIAMKAKLISASVGSGDVATVDFEAKVTDPGVNEVFYVATGATA